MSVIEAILGSDKKKPEFYELLGCDRRSTTEQITAEYKAKVRSVHPDKQMSENLKDSNEKFAKLQEAYSTLTDESKRRVYDSWLDSPIPGNFEEFSRNSKVVQMSTHWAVPKQQPMIDLGLKEEKKMEEKNDKWKDGRRYQSDIASKFRNYQV